MPVVFVWVDDEYSHTVGLLFVGCFFQYWVFNEPYFIT
jgi:hypothetical protein